MARFIKNFVNGRVEGEIQMLVGSCAVGLMTDVRFFPAARKTTALFKEFHEFISKHRNGTKEEDHFGRAIIMFTDKRQGDMYAFGKECKWNEDGPSKNHRSDNFVSVFTFHRNKPKAEPKQSLVRRAIRRIPFVGN